MIPKPIVDYAQGFSKILTPNGSEFRPNVPTIAIPLASYEDDQGNIIPSGTFGPVTQDTHNVYECYICPYTTAQRVIESRQPPPPHQHGPREWDPLPPDLMPPGGEPNSNFIGYAPIDVLHPDARDALSRGSFEEGDDIAGRLRVNGNLFLKASGKLASLDKRFKMCKLTNTELVKYKTQTANLVISRTNDASQVIAGRSVTNSSSYQFGANASGAAGIFTYHRERTAQAPGCCFTFEGHPDPIWVESRNSNLEMIEEFGPTRSEDFARLRDVLYQSYSPPGLRTDSIAAFLRRNYCVD